MNNHITRKQFLQTALWGGVSALVAPRELGAWQVSGPPLDVVIKNGRVIDGTGRAAFDAAVGIRGGVIADIGVIPDSAARQVIDAKGQYVCPGFIDPHAHEEILMVADPVLEKFVRQGVTTLVNGNCGHSVTPYRAKTVLEYWYREALISKKRSQMKVDWEGVDGYAKVIAGIGATINSAVLLGYGGIRWGAMHGGHDRPPTDAEWKEIERLVAMGLEQGAVGMSTGLAYRPCFYAKTDELIRVAQILAKHDKVYASHLRTGPNGAVEAVEIGEKAGCRVQLSHYRNAQSAFDLVTDANRRGVVTCADIIPQSTSHRRASNRMLEALMVFYPGVFDADDETLKSLVRNPKTRAEITKTIQFFNNDKNDVIIVHALTAKHKANEGQSIAALAKAAGKDPNDYFIEVILDESHPVVFAFDGDRREARAKVAAADADRLPPIRCRRASGPPTIDLVPAPTRSRSIRTSRSAGTSISGAARFRATSARPGATTCRSRRSCRKRRSFPPSSSASRIAACSRRARWRTSWSSIRTTTATRHQPNRIRTIRIPSPKASRTSSSTACRCWWMGS